LPRISFAGAANDSFATFVQDYTRTGEPILLEIQQREQDILEYLSREIEQPIAS
jgi:hypothetical protein